MQRCPQRSRAPLVPGGRVRSAGDWKGRTAGATERLSKWAQEDTVQGDLGVWRGDSKGWAAPVWKSPIIREVEQELQEVLTPRGPRLVPLSSERWSLVPHARDRCDIGSILPRGKPGSEVGIGSLHRPLHWGPPGKPPGCLAEEGLAGGLLQAPPST